MHMIRDVNQPLIVDALPIHCRHAFVRMSHDDVNRYLIFGVPCDRFKRPAERIEATAILFDLAHPREL